MNHAPTSSHQWEPPGTEARLIGIGEAAAMARKAGAARVHAAPEIHAMLYTSRSLIAPRSAVADVQALVASAARRNAALGLSGALIFTGTGFAQYLEGPRHAVERIMAAIRSDRRHADIVILRSAFAPTRRFAGWSLAYGGYSQRAGAIVERTRLSGTAGFGREVEQLVELMKISCADTRRARLGDA